MLEKTEGYTDLNQTAARRRLSAATAANMNRPLLANLTPAQGSDDSHMSHFLHPVSIEFPAIALDRPGIIGRRNCPWGVMRSF